MASSNLRLSNDEKIALLEELHRPLEEHWSVKTKFGLDPKSSEYIYKHHITRLEDIYSNHKNEMPNPPGLLYMSPVSQLYGINGLNVNNDEGRLKRKEEKWISNFQKHHFLTDGGVDKDEQPRSRGTSPQKPKPAVFGATGRANDHKKRKGEEKSPPRSKTARNACHDPNISPEDLVMLGLYRLDDNQQAIYRAFVEMLSGFDDYDKDNIVADAVRDAQGEADLLECYGGTVLPDPSAPPPDTTRPGSSGAQRRSVSPSALRHSADGPITTGAASGTTGSGPVRPRTAGAVGVGGQ